MAWDGRPTRGNEGVARWTSWHLAALAKKLDELGESGHPASITKIEARDGNITVEVVLHGRVKE